MIKRAMAAALVGAALMASVAPAGAAAKRTETFDYKGFAQVEADRLSIWIGPICFASDCTSGTKYKTVRAERWVSARIVDDNGARVRGVLIQEDGLRKAFCGRSGRVRIEGGKPLAVYVSGNPCGGTPSGVPTTGTVTTTFFRK